MKQVTSNNIDTFTDSVHPFGLTHTAGEEPTANQVNADSKIRHPEIIEELSHILANKKDGEVVFGAANEPLRQSQTEILTAIHDHLKAGNNDGHIVAPGGSGKTRTGIAIGAATASAGKKTLFVVDRQESLQKFAAEARRLMPDVPIGEVYQEEKTLGDMTFITINSLRARVKAYRDGREVADGAPIDPKVYDMVLWDEAHMYLAQNAQELKQEFAHAINLGFTATPRYYEGKEVENNFGPLITEIPYETARARGEVNHYSNHLINTGITTGLTDLLPDQEESFWVGKVSNRRDRNLIVADLYNNGRVQEGGKAEYLAGKPALVLVTSINHAHDQADAINEALMPALKADTVFRQHLIDQGIDPDKVERIAAPIHSGGTEKHDGMSLEARNKVLKDYNDRKTLMLVSTSLLQHSFDSPITQVLIDTVPRMTYVGVGQGGYRSTRVKNGKGPSIIVNMEDNDRPTLTFDDFTDAHKHHAEAGVQFPILEKTSGPTLSLLPELGTNRPVAPYKIVSGKNLRKLLVTREQEATAEQNRIARTHEDYLANQRHFTPQGYQHIRSLMVRIGRGDVTARDPFLKAITPFIDRTATRIAAQVFGADAVNEEIVKEVVQDTMLVLFSNQDFFGDHTRSWSNFQMRTQRYLRYLFEKVKKEQEKESAGKQLLTDSYDMLNKPVAAPETIIDGHKLEVVTENALSSLTPREALVLKCRFFGHEDTLDDAAKRLDVTRERAREIEAKALRKLRHPSRSDQLRPHLDGLDNDFPARLRSFPSPEVPEIKDTDALDNLDEFQRKIYVERDSMERLYNLNDNSLQHYLLEKGLEPTQYHILLNADLANDMEACALLMKDEDAIRAALTKAVKEQDFGDRQPSQAHMDYLVGKQDRYLSVLVRLAKKSCRSASPVAWAKQPRSQHPDQVESGRAEIERIFAHIDKTPYNKDQLIEATGLTSDEYEALMQANLRHNMPARECLRTNHLHIREKLAAAAEKLMRDKPYEANIRLKYLGQALDDIFATTVSRESLRKSYIDDNSSGIGGRG